MLAVVAIASVIAAYQWVAQHPAVIILVVAAGGAFLALRTRGAKAPDGDEARALMDLQLANERRILDDCVRICRETKSAETRISRARLGLRHVETLLAAEKLDSNEAARLEGYFKAMTVVASALEAFVRGVAAGPGPTRTKRYAEARALAESTGITDEILRAADVIHPTTGAPLTLLQLRGADTATNPLRDVGESAGLAAAAISRHRVTISAGSVDERRLAHSADARWIPAGETLRIGTRTIPGGLLWVGSSLPTVRSYGNDPALIDPDLPVDDRWSDATDDAMPYWPAYGSIEPRCRTTYLSWLASGRTESEVGLGYVFLFFYGLERRLLDDAYREQVATDEVSAIRAEIERLLALHPRGSFAAYASGFLDYIEGRWPEMQQTVTAHRRAILDGVPLGIRAALGRLALTGDPVPADLALAWIRSHPSPGLGRPLIVCAAEFDVLFLKRYGDTFGPGVVLKPNRSRIVHRYRPASSSFGGQEVRVELDLPDPTQVTGPWNRLHAVADRCCQDLDSYRRLVARRPEARGGPEAFAMLPAELNAALPTSIAGLQTWTDSQLAHGDIATADGATLLRLWQEAGGDTARPRPTAVAIAQVLGKWGVGIEPDTRFTGPPIASNGRVVLFRNPAPTVDTPSEAFAGAALASQLCAAIAMADGQLHADEVHAVDRHLALAPELDESERRRLLAHFHWSLEKPPSVATLSRRLRQLAPDARAMIAGLVLRLVAGDGHADPAEVKLLARLYKALDLDPGRVHADIHRTLAGDPAVSDDPAVVLPGREHTGFGIPPRPSTSSTVTLDHARIRLRVEESARVATMLGTIFADDEAQPRATLTTPPEASGLAGLDRAHSTLLRSLGGIRSISRTNFEVLAAEANVLPDGAVETLNDAAFARADAPLCEGDDPIDLDQQVLEVMLR